MIKEAKNVDFYTTGRQPSDQDFARISEWIKKDKQKQTGRKRAKRLQKKIASSDVVLEKVEDKNKG